MKSSQVVGRVAAVCLLAVIPSASPLEAQFLDRFVNPKIEVTLQHAPGLGVQPKRVAFGPATGTGECVDSFLDAVVADFVNNGVEVIDRQHLESLLAEHNFKLSGFVDQTTAAALGKILGPAALVFLKVQRCATESDTTYRDGQDFRGQPVRTYTSRTRAFLKGSIQVVDLASSRIFAAKTIDADESQQNQANGAIPEAPAKYDVLDQSLRNAGQQVHRLFFPWSENRTLYFFDDKDCDLKVASNMLRGGDAQGALRQSEDNLAACSARPGVKPKLLWHAQYNVGMANFVVGNYDKALAAFNEATRLGGGDIVAESATECRRAQQLAQEMQRVEQRAAVETAGSVVPAASAGGSQARNRPAVATGGGKGQSAAPAGTTEERLKKLDALCKQGLLTKDECAKKRAEILSDL